MEKRGKEVKDRKGGEVKKKCRCWTGRVEKYRKEVENYKSWKKGGR